MSAASDLLGEYQHVIGEIKLVTGSRGVFDVWVDQNLIYSKHASGRHAQPGEILTIFQSIVGSDTPTYPKS